MLPLEQPDRIQIAFDDHRLVANAGLLLPVTLAQRLGLSQLVDRHVDLGRAPGRANTGDKMMTLVASALAGGDCIDDADVLRAGSTDRVLGGVVKAPSTLGTFLRSFRWGHVRQLDRVSRELLARAWSAGAGPGDAPLTIDLDSTICETFGLAKEGARHHGYTGQRGYHPLLARVRTTWAGTGDVLMCRLREGRANTVRGAAHFLRETVGRVRYAGATGPLTLRADSGFYAHALVAVCRDKDVRSSITVRQHESLRSQIDAIPEADWTPFESKPDAATVRLIVRRVKPTPGSQLALFANYSYHAFITDRDGDTLYLEADHRRHAEIENAIRDLKYGVGPNHLPSRRFPANPEPAEGGLAVRPEPAPYSIRGHGPQPGSLDNARRPGRARDHHQDPQSGASSLSPDGSPAQRANSPCICPRAGPGKTSSVVPWQDSAPSRSQPDGGNQPADPPSAPRNIPANSHQPGPRGTLLAHRLPNYARRDHGGPPESCRCGYLTPPASPSVESNLPRSPSLAHHPWFQPQRPSLRWIRAKVHGAYQCTQSARAPGWWPDRWPSPESRPFPTSASNLTTRVYSYTTPFPVLGIDSDNDSVFINDTLTQYCADRGNRIHPASGVPEE